jgi:hypothetical protein
MERFTQKTPRALRYLGFDIGFLKTNEVKSRSEAPSLFDLPEADKCLLAFGEFNVERSMLMNP